MSLVVNLRNRISSPDWRGAAGPLLVAWLLCMISLPIVQWVAGEQALITGVVVSVSLQAALVVALLYQSAGARKTATLALTVAVLGWAAEAVGSKTGFPFGAYHYTDRLQPQVVGVPLLIPLAWLMMMPPAWAVAQRITGRAAGLLFVAVSALAFTAWDLYLDPQMVHWGLWVWDQPGQYLGIPLINYAGWFLVSALITLVARPPALRTQPLFVVYALTWLIEVTGLILFWQLYAAALAGFVGMGVFVALAWPIGGVRRSSQDSHRGPREIRGV
jgi:putative membrane protein